MINRIRALRTLLLLAGIVAGIVLWGRAARQIKEENALANAALLQQSASLRAEQMEAGLVFALPAEGIPEDSPMPVFGLRWIQFSEQVDGPHYALFLPGAAKTLGLRVFLSKPGLLLDGAPLATGQALTLAPGEHLLEAGQGMDAGKEWLFTVLYGSEIPCMMVETASGNLDAIYADREYREPGAVTLLGQDGSLEYAGTIEGIGGRGNSTWDFPPKKTFLVKLSEKTALFGMPAARRWLLISNVYDPSLLRIQTSFALAREAGMAFTPESRQTDLYINGEYYGCFLLCERVEVGSGRVEITDLDEMNQAALVGQQPGQEWPVQAEPAGGGLLVYAKMPFAAAPRELTGGYLLELELKDWFFSEGRCGFVSRQGQAVSIRSPMPASREQAAYVAELYQRLEDILYPSEQAGEPDLLEQVIDLHSFAQKYLLEEIIKNHDASKTSQYFYKQPDAVDKRLFAGPAWDYDVSLAGPGFPWGVPEELKDPVGWWANQGAEEHAIWAGLYSQPAFRKAVRACYFKEFVPALQIMLEEGWVCADAERLADSACIMDALRWQGGDYDPDAFPKEYLAEAEKIEAFLAARMAWLQSQWPKEAAE